MPEGPEIQRAADTIAKALVGKVARELYFAFEHLKQFEQELQGRRIEAIEARGKAILTRFENGLNIYSHNQLYGRWMVRKVYNYPKTNRQLRLAIHTDRHSALLYSASDIEVLYDYELESHPFLSKLGPDVLDERVTPADVVARLQSKRFRRRSLTTLLLDQAFMAGLGNYLRSEVLHVAGIAPQQRPADLTPEQLERLAEAILDLSRRSYRTKGVTNDPDRVARLRQNGQPRRNYRFYVFNREDRDCYRCGGLVVRESLGGRRLYYCRECQTVD